MSIVLTRPVSASLASCELTFYERQSFDLAAARQEHAAYEAALTGLGAEIVQLPVADELPDAVFVEDAALVLDELAIIPYMGAASRRPETVSMAAALGRYCRLEHVVPPGTFDGGDVMVAERTIYIGRTARSNDAGIAQVRSLTAPYDYTVVGLDPVGCLHLKSACTYLGRNTVLVNPAWIDPGVFKAYDVLLVDPDEPDAANALAFGGALIYPLDFPRTQARLEAAGFRVVALENRELRKAESAMTCLSVIVGRSNHPSAS